MELNIEKMEKWSVSTRTEIPEGCVSVFAKDYFAGVRIPKGDIYSTVEKYNTCDIAYGEGKIAFILGTGERAIQNYEKRGIKITIPVGLLRKLGITYDGTKRFKAEIQTKKINDEEFEVLGIDLDEEVRQTSNKSD